MAITRVTSGELALQSVPFDAPAGEQWVYQVALPLQLGAGEAGLLVNIRRGGALSIDFEAGSDLVVLRDWNRPGPIYPLQRGGPREHPGGGPGLYSAYTMRGGFVPVGARLNGAPHPHEGTGFGLSQQILFHGDRRTDDAHAHAHAQHLVVQQYRYDGAKFEITSSQAVGYDTLLAGWHLDFLPLCNAIPDGADLLLAMRGARPNRPGSAGVSRWRRENGVWRVVEFVAVSDEDEAFEPTLIRDGDGALLMSARGYYRSQVSAERFGSPKYWENHLFLWRSSDGSATWEKLIELPRARSGTPLSLNRALDGTPYFALNPYREIDSRGRHLSSIEMREALQIVPLNPDRRTLGDPLTVRDARADWGQAPEGSIWRVDIPSGLTVQTGDGRWRHLLAFRGLHQREVTEDAPPTPRTGTYFAEVLSDGPALPTWDFNTRLP